MSKFRRYGKIIVFDTLAVLCFIGVILFGWIPGPGGIPLFLLGLSLLAVNHDWAERWLETAKHKGVTFKKWLFPDVQWIRYTYDIVSVALFALGLYMLLNTTTRWIEGIAVVMMCASLFVILLNRDRFDKISKLLKHKR
jgi:hypothetical protein